MDIKNVDKATKKSLHSIKTNAKMVYTNFNEICSRHYLVDNLKDFFEQVYLNDIFEFLNEAGLYQKYKCSTAFFKLFFSKKY